jgi:hypothetical protein
MHLTDVLLIERIADAQLDSEGESTRPPASWPGAAAP